MTSFLKLGIFEREAKAPELNIKQHYLCVG
jgi:hypothetical protein